MNYYEMSFNGPNGGHGRQQDLLDEAERLHVANRAMRAKRARLKGLRPSRAAREDRATSSPRRRLAAAGPASSRSKGRQATRSRVRRFFNRLVASRRFKSRRP